MAKRASQDRGETRPALSAGERIYAIGDIHGRFDLLCKLMNKIERDASRRPRAMTRLVVLGDFIDRGADSAKLIEVFSAVSPPEGLVVLKGNHEAALLEGLAGDRSALDAWIDFGGDATLRSFGASDDDIWPADSRMLLANVRRIIPKHVIRWLSDLPTMYRAGSYLFVHAGVRPDVPLNLQSEDDMLWIRGEFTESTADHGVIVVHGHTISERVCERSNRIGVDTGAYRTGRLSAVGLEAEHRWIIESD